MRLFRILVPVLFSLPLIGVACGGGDDAPDNEPFDTFQDCYDDHTKVDSFSHADGIAICCLDHPIGGVDFDIVCGDTAQACDDYVDAQIADADLTLAEIQEGCDKYISE